MTKAIVLLGALLVTSCALAGLVGANSVCPDFDQPTHTYGAPLGHHPHAAAMQGSGTGLVSVWDTNVADCNGDGIPGDWDGDLDAGTTGGAFGYLGTWEAACGYDLNLHSGLGTASDFTGLSVSGVLGMDDMGASGCAPDGVIAPAVDPSDCLVRFVNSWNASACVNKLQGSGATETGADDLYWILVQAPSTAGTLTANF